MTRVTSVVCRVSI